LVYTYDVTEEALTRPTAFVDSDWAGDQKTRRSTSGVVVMVGSAIVTTSSRTQTTVALSSAEAELLAMTSGVVDLLFLRNLLREIGIVGVTVTMHSDSQAALDALHRGGVNKMKHIAIRSLFLSSLVKSGVVVVKKVKGEDNVADILTKHVPSTILMKLLGFLPLVLVWSTKTKAGVDEEFEEDDG